MESRRIPKTDPNWMVCSELCLQIKYRWAFFNDKILFFFWIFCAVFLLFYDSGFPKNLIWLFQFLKHKNSGFPKWTHQTHQTDLTWPDPIATGHFLRSEVPFVAHRPGGFAPGNGGVVGRHVLEPSWAGGHGDAVSRSRCCGDDE